MGFTVDQADQMVEMFEAATKACVVTQVRPEMRARGREWKRAAEHLAEMGEAFTIELVGAVVPYMGVAREDLRRGEMTVSQVERVLHRDGGCSIHVLDEDGRPLYLNFHSAASPVVVKR